MRSRLRLIVVAIATFTIGTALADDQMVTKKSSHDVAVTMDRLEAVVKEKGLGVVARIDHAAAAGKAGLSLRPTQVLIFGNPKLGTPLMNSNQAIGIDLPLRVVAWEDDGGQTWIAYYPPQDLVARHGIGDQAEIVKKMTGALDTFTNHAAGN